MSFFNGMISDCSHNKYMFIVNEKSCGLQYRKKGIKTEPTVVVDLKKLCIMDARITVA